MNIDYIPFEIEETLKSINSKKKYVIDDIIKFHIIFVCNKTDNYKNNQIMLKNNANIIRLPTIIGKYISKINDDTVIQYYNDTDIELKYGFWDMINKYKIYNCISPETFTELLKCKVCPYDLFEYKDIVHHFDDQCLNFIKSHFYMTEILLLKEFEKSSNNRNKYFPKSLTPKMKTELTKMYIESPEVSPNYLKLIINAIPTKEFPIPDEIRLSAKKKFYEWWDNNNTKMSSYTHGISVSFVSKPDWNNDINSDGLNINCEFSKEWISNNLDYATLLNNFIYVFGYCDCCFRSSFVSLKNKASTFEKISGIQNKTDYFTNNFFRTNQLLFTVIMAGYYHELILNGINMESIFKWYFELYLPSEFNIQGFYFLQTSKKTSYSEKCILLSCTIDSILKQFNMYCLNKCIDRELIEISSKPLFFSEVSSLIEKKYVYVSHKDIYKECYLLFSDQSLLTYIENKKEKYIDLPTMLSNENITINDYQPFQKTDIKWLISRGTLFIDNQGILHSSKNKVQILKELYDKEVICYSYVKNNRGMIDELIRHNDLRTECSLFSQPEQNYLDYMLNNSNFGNGPALRNNYIHGTYPLDTKKNEQDYYELLKIMVLIIIKINEEFSLRT